MSICKVFGLWEGIAPKVLEILLDETTIIDPGFRFYRLYTGCARQGFDSVEAKGFYRIDPLQKHLLEHWLPTC